ncbi:MAG: Hint domain-containing protein [Marinibacterium sp.]
MAHAPAQSVLVYPAAEFSVAHGAHLGDPVSILSDLTLGDIYELSRDAHSVRLGFHARDDGSYTIAADTDTGRRGATLHLDGVVELMSPDGVIAFAVVIVETDQTGHVANVFLLPMAPLAPRTGYTLISASRKDAARKFAQLACVSFSAGTHITMSTGEQVKIESIKPGDRVLTRDSGARKVVWIGQTTVRAVGDFAPIVVKARTLNNENDLVVSPNHRLFVYQRTDQIGAGRPDLLVQARHLINDNSIYVRTGGYVDYFQILFERHHIIYAEGIAAESALITPRTRPALPPELIKRLEGVMTRHDRRSRHGVDVAKALLDRPDAIDLLLQASAR